MTWPPNRWQETSASDCANQFRTLAGKLCEALPEFKDYEGIQFELCRGLRLEGSGEPGAAGPPNSYTREGFNQRANASKMLTAAFKADVILHRLQTERSVFWSTLDQQRSQRSSALTFSQNLGQFLDANGVPLRPPFQPTAGPKTYNNPLGLAHWNQQ